MRLPPKLVQVPVPAVRHVSRDDYDKDDVYPEDVFVWVVMCELINPTGIDERMMVSCISMSEDRAYEDLGYLQEKPNYYRNPRMERRALI